MYRIFSRKTIIALIAVIIVIAVSTTLYTIIQYNSIANGIKSVKKEIAAEKEILYDNEVEPGVYEVSLVRLIAHPEIYHGKTVVVCGIGNFEFEGTAIYLNTEAFKYHNYKSSVWLNFTEKFVDENIDKLNELKGKYVRVKGVFDAEKLGHFALCSGSIDVISYEEY